MIPPFVSKINKVLINIGCANIKQQDLFQPQPVKVDLTELNQKDCLLFAGDNLNYLTALASSHKPIIDFIYIDPPYNTGSTFLYNDSRKSPSNGVFGRHTSWMEFMTPRLVMAHEILKEDGVIAVSIDDYEHAYLKVLLDMIFGEENFIGNISVCRSKNGKGSRKNIAINHEYLLVYGKSKSAVLPGTPDDYGKYDKQDEHGLYRIDGLFRKKGEASSRDDRPNMFYPLYYDTNGQVYLEYSTGLKSAYPIDSKGIERRWLWGRDTAKENSWKLYASPKGTIYVKNYSSIGKRKKIRSMWQENSLHYTDKATTEIKKIFGDKAFDTPKPIAYIKDIIHQMTSKNALILDFFAGSGTTAHAAQELNQQDEGTRKTILIESDDLIPEWHVASKLGFSRLYEITEHRLNYIKKISPNYSYITKVSI